MQIGYKLAAEGYGPQEIIRQAVLAERAGFDFVEMSDHFHPWLDAQGHSSFTWSVLGAIAAKTSTLRWPPASPARPSATTRRSSRRPRRPWR